MISISVVKTSPEGRTTLARANGLGFEKQFPFWPPEGPLRSRPLATEGSGPLGGSETETWVYHGQAMPDGYRTLAPKT